MGSIGLVPISVLKVRLVHPLRLLLLENRGPRGFRRKNFKIRTQTYPTKDIIEIYLTVHQLEPHLTNSPKTQPHYWSTEGNHGISQHRT